MSADAGSTTTSIPKSRPKIAALRLEASELGMLRDAFGKHGIETIPVPFETYQQRLSSQKFEAVAVTLDSSADEFLKALRGSVLNKHSVIYALAQSPEQASTFFKHGINAVLFKPLDREAVAETVEATYRLLSGELRCYPRVALVTAVSIEVDGQREQATSWELSGGGMSLRARMPLHPGQKASLAFALPGSSPVLLSAAVSWVQPGKVGVRFDKSDARDKVRDWLYDYLEIV